MIETGKVLQNRYRIEKHIGQGGMGAVYVATDERFGSTVAIKETLFTDEKFLRAFEREARLLNSLRHHALPRVSDHFVEGNGQFLVMEYIAGEDLSEQLENEGKLFPVSEVLNWADQLLDALDYLHSQAMPVIHRDIKPQNLKLTPQGQVILLDFGLAKGNVTNSDSATAAKSIVGYSRNYASLEQIQGTGTDPRSDLYSLAATIYHLLTGQPPADALTRAMNVLSDHADPLVPMTKYRVEIPLTVANILHESLALNANQRPTSAQEMRQMLAEADLSDSTESIEPVRIKSGGTDLFNQKTQIQAVAGNLKQSEIKTEAFSDDLSKQTLLRPQVITGDFDDEQVEQKTDSEETAVKPKRRGLAIGATLGSLVLVGSAASAVYFYSSETFGLNENSGKTIEKKVVNAPANSANTILVETNTNISNVESNSNIVTSIDSTEKPTSKEELTKEQTKQATTKQVETPKIETQTTKTQTTVKDENPKVKTTPIPTPNKPEVVPPPTPRNDREIPPEVWRKMTPRQRQQLKRAMEMERQQRERERENQQPRPPSTPY